MLDLKNFKKYKIDLKKPLLIIKSSKGFIACGYINIDICNLLNETAAIVQGVENHTDMLNANITKVSNKARDLGIYPGITGKEALEILS